MPNLTSTLAVKLIDGITGPAKGASAALGQIGKATEALGKIDAFRKQSKRLEEMRRAHEKARDTVKGLASQLMAAESPSKRLQAAYERATASADKLGNKLDWQKAKVRGAASELERMGASANNLVGAENRLRASIDGTTAAIRRQEVAAARSQQRRQAIGTVAAGGAAVVGWRARRFGADAVKSAGSFDTSVRMQQFATDIEIAEQKRVLIPQAERIGQDTKFSNQDIIQAQTEFANGLAAQLKRADVIAPIINQAKNYALTLKDVTMTDAAMAVRGFLLSLGKDISTPEKADSEARRASNMLIRSSKIGGLNHEDLQMFVQRGGSAGRLAGLSDETMLALAVALKRSNISGDQAGTALRTASSKLVAPGRKQLAAMSSAGIRFEDYAKLSGGGLSVENFDKKFQNDFGKKLSPAVRAKLQEAFEDEDIVGDVGKFKEAVKGAVEPMFARTRKGKIAVKDAEAISNKAGEFWRFAIENVDTERLLQDIISRDPSLGVLNAIMTDKHGNKFGLVAKAFEQFLKDRADLANVSPDYGDKAAALLQGGLGGAINQLTGAIETLKLRIGSENESWLTPTINKMAGSIDWLTERVKQNPATSAALGGVGAAGAAIGGTFKFLNDIVGGNAPAIALTGSAFALTKSAAALTGAAGTLAVGGAGGAGAGAAAAGAAGAASRLGMLLRGAGLTGAAIGAWLGLRAIGEANEKHLEGVAPGEVHNKGREKAQRSRAKMQEHFLEERGRLGIIPQEGAQAGAQAGTNLGDGIASGITATGPKAEGAARSIMSTIRSLFGAGVDVPVRVNSPAITPPAANKQSSAPQIRGGNISVVVHGAGGDPNEIAEKVSRQVGEKTAESLRGAFTGGDFA